MSLPAENSQELDFEDVIAQLEKNIHKSRKGESAPAARSSNHGQEDGHNIIMNMAEFEPELQVLCEALMEHVQSKCRISKRFNYAHKPEKQLEAQQDSAFVKEIFKAEVKATLTQMQKFRECELEGSKLLSTSERTTIASLKRQVRERDTEIRALKQMLKQANIIKYRLEHAVAGRETAVQELESANKLFESEAKSLREKNAALTKRCSDADARHKSDHYERQRLHQTIAKFRREVVVAHQNASNSRIEAKQAKKRIEHLEARAAEARGSSLAVAMRIRELKNIQDEMVATMKGIQESGDDTASRRVFKNLAEQRSRLVGRIANLLTRRKQDESPQYGIRQDSPQTSENSGGKMFGTASPSSSPGHTNQSPAGDSNGPSSDEEGLNRIKRFETFRKFGNDLTRMTSSRRSRKAVLANVDKACQAVEKDTDILRQIIEQKDKELERMEDQLTDATEHVSSLEMTLEMERQRKRLEKRDVRNPTLEKAYEEMRSFTTTRWKKTTLFDWQNQVAKEVESKAGKLAAAPVHHAGRSGI